MKFLSVTGPKEDIDRVVNDYLSKYEIHLENALSELKTVKSLRPYIEINPYKDKLTKAEEFASMLGTDKNQENPTGTISIEEASETLATLESKFSDIYTRTNALEAKKEDLKASYERLRPFLGFDFDIHSVLQFKFIKYRFGKITRDYYKKLEHYVYENLDTVFYRCSEDEQYVWGVYFVPAGRAGQIDAVFSSLHFERIHLPDEYEGIPQEVGTKLQSDIHDLDVQLQECREESAKLLNEYKNKVLLCRDKFRSLTSNFDVRKLAACTKEGKQVFYILCGWMTESDAARFEKDVADDKNLFCLIESNEDQDKDSTLTPPTKLKNPGIFRPFELFVRMYGLPSYNEIDPTIFVALTYSFIFGAMFGDVGQGLCLVIGGALLYHFKKMELAACLSSAGVFSTIFGSTPRFFLKIAPPYTRSTSPRFSRYSRSLRIVSIDTPYCSTSSLAFTIPSRFKRAMIFSRLSYSTFLTFLLRLQPLLILSRTHSRHTAEHTPEVRLIIKLHLVGKICQ